jgi:hypothetical protein
LIYNLITKSYTINQPKKKHMKKTFLAMMVTAAAISFTGCGNEKKNEAGKDGVEVKTDRGNTSVNVSGSGSDDSKDDDKTEGTNVTIDKNGVSVDGADGEKVKIDESGVSVNTGDTVKTKVTTGNGEGTKVTTGGAGGVKVDTKGGVKVNAGGVKVDVGGGKVKIN